MTRDVASRFNNLMGETFIIPEAKIQDYSNYVTGTDGQKMSKSKGNTIDIFVDDKSLKKQIMKIQTKSLSVDEAKDPNDCNVFKLYKIIASEDDVKNLSLRYREAKEILYSEIINKYAKNRKKFFELMDDKQVVEDLLIDGAKKARVQAQKVLKRVRANVGY